MDNPIGGGGVLTHPTLLSLTDVQVGNLNITTTEIIVTLVILAFVLVLPSRGGDRTERILRKQTKLMKRQNKTMARGFAAQSGGAAQGPYSHGPSLVPDWARAGSVRQDALSLARVLVGAAIVLGILISLALTAVMWVKHPALTRFLLGTSATGWLWMGWRKRGDRKHQRRIVEPLAAGLAVLFKWKTEEIPDPEDWLEIPRTVGAKVARSKPIRLNRRRPHLPLSAGVWMHDRTARPRLWWVRQRGRLVKLDPRTSSLALRLEEQRAARRGGLVIKMLLPYAWTGTGQQRDDMTAVVNARIPGEWEPHWDTTRYYVEYRPTPRPPDMVRWADIVPLLSGLKNGEIILGLDNRGKPYIGSLETDYPHWAFACGTGSGKTVELWNIAAQLVHQGATGGFIDPKMSGGRPLIGVPGFTVLNNPLDPEVWGHYLAGEVAELYSRMSIYNETGVINFPRRAIFIDELNMFGDIMTAHYRKNRQKGDPQRPPFWDHIATLARMGRELGMHLIVSGQRFDNASMGGFGLRDGFGLRILGRFTPQAWKMLVGTMPIPRSIKKRGRMIVADGGDHTWIQTPLSTADEIHEFMIAARESQGWTAGGPIPTPPRGTVTTPLPGLPGARAGSDAPQGEGSAPAGDRPPLHLVQRLYSLQEASMDLGEGIVSMRYETLKWHRRMKPESFPKGTKGRGTKYTADELKEWYSSYSASQRTGSDG